MNIFYNHGLIIKNNEYKIAFDLKKTNNYKYDYIFVSHAHSDHIQAIKKNKCYMTEETRRLAETYVGWIWNYNKIKFGEKIKINDKVRIKIFDAGHILGSAQFLLETPEETILYTGDINVYDTIISKSAEIIEADKLIIDSTYGNEKYIFPNRQLIYAEIINWIKEIINNGAIPAFNVYPVGKSQEIISLINECMNVPVIVSKHVFEASKIYGNFLKKIDCINISSKEGKEILKNGEAVLVSEKILNPNINRKIFWAKATGWALKYKFKKYNAAFPLSSHSDYEGLIYYIENVKPKKIYTIYGYSNHFSRILNKLGYFAKSIY
ncbi:MAG: MBL fold metallo-hydrolase [Nitrososphaerota archaeon]